MVQIINRVVNDMNIQAKNKGISLTFVEPKEKMPDVMADALRIEEVLVNLLGNALKYTEKGSIKVLMERQSGYVITSIADTGRGIPKDSVTHLFTKFFRVESNITAGVKGSGIGLFVCKSIVQAHGGKIWVESIEGKGSVFSFSIPIA